MSRGAVVAAGARQLHPPDVVEGWWRKVVPGDRLAVKYTDDKVLHERLVGWTSEVGWMIVRSPDGDEWEEDVSGNNPDSGPAWGRLLPPKGQGGRRMSLYSFRDRLDEKELQEFIRRSAEYSATVDQMTGPRPRRYTNHVGVNMNLDEVFRRLPLPLVAEDTALPGRVWLASETLGGVARGTEVTPGGADEWVARGRFALSRVKTGADEIWVKCDAVAIEDVPFYGHGRATTPRKAAAEELFASKPAVVVDTAPRKAAAEELFASKPVVVVEKEAASDARTLWVDWDAQGERHKEWRNVCSEAYVHEFEPYPLDGAPTCLYMCKGMLRNGGDPRRWMENFLREKSISSNERIVHEMRCLVDCLWYLGCVDQVNLGGLVGAEVVARRLASIVEAYGDAGRVDWQAARHYRGQASVEEVIAPSLRSFVMKKAKEEMEMHTAKNRMSGLRGAPAKEVDEGGEGEQNDAARGGGARGHGRGGRQARQVPPEG